MDGPRAVRAEERASLIELADLCFRRQAPRSMADDYPLLLAEANAEGCRVMVDAGRVVSAANVLLRDAIVLGTRLSTAAMGAVCTHPDHREQGLGGRVVDDAMRHAAASGADVMLISGNRDLYRRRHAVRAGRWWRYTVSGTRHHSADVRWRVDVLPDPQVRLAAALYRYEPVRFVRPPEDWQAFLESGRCMDRASQLYGVWDQGHLSAYLVLSEPDGQGVRWVGEFAGQRTAVARGLAQLAAIGPVVVHVAGWDGAGRREVEMLGAAGEPVAMAGVAAVLRLGSLMDKARGRFAEVLGPAAAARVKAEEHTDSFTFSFGSQRARIGRTPGTLLLLGAPDDTSDEWRELPAPVAGMWRAVFPLALPWYGLNYQ